jgi:hypothetical protein
VFDLQNRTTPGWYKIIRNHNLSWWQRNFSDKSPEGWEQVKAPEAVPMAAPEVMKNGVYLLHVGQLVRIAEENKLHDLSDAPGEGVVFVAEPGVGVHDSVNLASECP